MKLDLSELMTIKVLLQEEIKRIGEYNTLIHKDYKNNIKTIYNNVNSTIIKVNNDTKTSSNSIKKYTFSTQQY